MSQRRVQGIAAALGAVLMFSAAAGHGAGKAEKPAAAKAEKKWSYTGATGPAKWSTLNPAFVGCAENQFQSPIDIPDATTRKGDFPSLLFNYKPTPLKIVDTGYTIEVDYAPGSFVTIDDKSYELTQFHFHKPSEEKVNGRGHDMDVHLVHRSKDGKIAYIAVQLDRGKENPAIKVVMDNMPKAREDVTTVEGKTISALELLPGDKGYYKFTGTLTTPPCSPDITWVVLKTPVQVSGDTIARFGRAYPMNARPTQPVAGRDIAATR